ncbi:CooT family nickel-binding protein [Butyrivibrio sp. VCB2006]|uniref:CooT family nickel-binding protein n=1 Tax=Butyrivibrio sp. VCB2006 TaxID=1280679 RepID=UPI0004011A59|nr:CooT family nickel-binding protein [Butyrivibrio sp. VCB2006]
MCLSTAVRADNPDVILMEYVQSLSIDGDTITLVDLMGEKKVIRGSLTFADLTGAVLKIDCR